MLASCECTDGSNLISVKHNIVKPFLMSNLFCVRVNRPVLLTGIKPLLWLIGYTSMYKVVLMSIMNGKHLLT